MNTKTNNTNLQTNFDLEKEGIQEFLIDSLKSIKDEIHQTFSGKSYSMQDFWDDNIDCLHALMYQTQAEA